MSNENEFKSNFFKKVAFDEKTRVVRTDGAGEAITEIMEERFNKEELAKTVEVMETFHQASAGLFTEATQVMSKAFNDNEELGSLSLNVETQWGDLEVAMNRPESGFTKDNVASATGLGITHKLDNDTFESIYTDLESVFDN